VSSMVSCNTHDFLVFIQFFVLSNDGFGLLRGAIECWVEFIPFFIKMGRIHSILLLFMCYE
jgi:hypothetical protein